MQVCRPSFALGKLLKWINDSYIHRCAGASSPWSPPLALPAPPRIAPLCSSASQLLWRSQTSHARASSATAPRLPDADAMRA
jgi:hypothetical protein